MRRLFLSNDSWLRVVRKTLEWSLSSLSIYVIPAAIGLVSLAAVFFWDAQHTAAPDEQLAFRAFIESQEISSPSEALIRLATATPKKLFETRMSEAPVWFTFDVKAASDLGKIIEFPSRHAQEIACWDAVSERPLGHSIASSSDGQIRPLKAGYALKLDNTGHEIVCRASFVGPGRLTAQLWSPEQLDLSAQEFHRRSGLLDGGLLVLSIFVLVAALINRQKLYLIFGIWLLLGLRVGATSGGWDDQWLNQTIPGDWLTLARSVTLASYALLTITLYRTLFKDELERTGYATAIGISHWLCLPLLVCAFVLPRSVFIPTVWLLAGPSLLVMMLSLARIVIQTRSRVAYWYGASLAITFLSSLSEILAAAFGVTGLLGMFNSVTAALASSLLASLAIAEQMRQEHAQRLEIQAELTHTYEAMPIGLFTLDMQGRFLRANPATVAMLGDNVLTRRQGHWRHFFDQGTWTQLHQMVSDTAGGEMEISGRPAPGSTAPQRFLVKAAMAGHRIEGSLQNVTEKAQATENLTFLAVHDPLTQVLNRRGIRQAVNDELARVGQGAPLTLAYLDLDRFKLINDLFGHGAGDAVLRQVCNRVSELLSNEMKFGRVGGDEFVILFPGTPITLASVVCQGIVDKIGTRPYNVGERAFYVRGSIGLIEAGPGMKFNDAMSSADRACLQAKSTGSGGLVVYEQGAPAFQAHEAELKLIALLSTSSATDGLYLEMQPIMSLRTPHDSLNFEVLLRMRDANGNAIRTDRLIAAGEASGRMDMIDRWVLQKTLAWLRTHLAQLTRTQFVCVNLSGASLNDEKFLQDAYALLQQNLSIAKHLCLEITEGVAVRDMENTRQFVNRVHDFGAKVALDDFGAGYTSFSYLKAIKADLLKIDGSLIVNMNEHPNGVSIVETIVRLAGNLGMRVIAEWAEDNATVQTLIEIGCDYVQGFAVARPQAPDKILTVDSSAGFIQDRALADYVSLIGRAGSTLPPVNQFLSPADTGPLH